MAHFAELDENNIVKRVIVLNNLQIFDMENKIESEGKGVNICKELYGQDTKWVQTSYNKNFRYNYASPGYKYDETMDAFIPPQPYDSWTLNVQDYTWNSPVPMPNDNTKAYYWDENSLNWKTYN